MMRKVQLPKGMFRKLLACLLLLVMIPISALAASFEAKTTSTVKVYSKTSATTANYLGSVKKGTTVTVTAESGDWYKITYNGKTGYALKKYFSVNKTLMYTKTTTKVYTTASTSSKVVDTLTADYPLYALSKTGKYTYVTTKDGKASGYVYTSNLVTTPVDRFAVSESRKSSYSANGSTTTIPKTVKSTQSYMSNSMTTEKKIEYMLYGAQSKLGCKYTNSGANNTYTFSNASFVKTCFGWLGVTLGSKPKEIGHNGKWAFISRKNLKRGDVVCFECDTADSEVVDHVGIYLGKGYFIHASNAANRVIVSKMSSGYYYKAFCWGRRIL